MTQAVVLIGVVMIFIGICGLLGYILGWLVTKHVDAYKQEKDDEDDK